VHLLPQIIDGRKLLALDHSLIPECDGSSTNFHYPGCVPKDDDLAKSQGRVVSGESPKV